MKRCIVFCAGEAGPLPSGFCIGPEELVIACDAGYRSAREAGVLPHLLIGDFDSLGEQLPEGIETLRFPVEKDDTDGMLALREGLRRGFRRFVLFFALGGRLDHTIANLQSLNFLARQGARGVLVEEHYSVTSILNGEIRFAAASRGMLSVFAQGGEARGVYLEGLKYPQHGFTLRDDYPMGVSNEFTGVPARVAVTACCWWRGRGRPWWKGYDGYCFPMSHTRLPLTNDRASSILYSGKG